MTWLAAGLVADLAVYPAEHLSIEQAAGWIVLDLWLALRVAFGGWIALAVFRGLLLMTVVAYPLVAVLSVWADGLSTPSGPLSTALAAMSLWCLTAPALRRHVHPVRRLLAAR